MAAPLALLLFAGGTAASLVASEFLVRGVNRLGRALGVAAGVIGLLTALGADGPEISSAITALLSGAREVGLGVILGSNLFNLAALLGLSALIAGRIRFRPALLWVDGGIALFVTAVIGCLFLLRLSPWIAVIAIGAAFMPYVVWLTRQPVRGDDVRARSEDPQAPAWIVIPAVAVIIGGSYAMVRGALVIGDLWNIPRAVLGTVVIAAITSLPNAYAASRLALTGNGTAVLSLAFNSNTLNLLAGVALPALVLGGLLTTAGAVADLAWLLALTVLAIALGWWLGGLTRWAGGALIAGYLAFLVVVIR
ncbi:MAG TPA: hypothetical protein VIT43_07100 [Candidatus Dormibacteraeota bacterium]